MSSGTNALYLEIDKRCNGSCSCTSKIGNFVAKREDTSPGAIGFTRYTHELEHRGTFKLNRSLGHGEELLDDLKDVNSVSVYYWDGDISHEKPLLLEVIKNGNTQYYYRYENGEQELDGTDEKRWKYVSGVHKLQDRLDDRNCGRNKAIVFNLNNPTPENCSIDSNCMQRTRNISSTSQSPPRPPGGEYTVQEYTVRGRDTKISRVTHKGDDTTGINLPNDYTVSRIRICSYLGPPEIPLMLQFIKQGSGGSQWFYSKDKSGTEWGLVSKTTGFYNDTKGEIPTEKLTTGLDYVRCVRDSEVTMDLTKYPNKTKYKYCCTYHSSGYKVSVQDIQVSCTTHHANSITAYKHSIKEADLKLSKIKYYLHAGSNDRKNITLSNPFPIFGPLSVYVFYCNKDNPVLIYIENNGQNDVKGWYQKDKLTNSDNGSEEWTEVQDLQDIAPINFNGLTCEQWKVLVKVLKDAGGCTELKECPPDNSSFWVKLFGGGGGTVASGATVGGVGYGGWYTYNNYFLDVVVRLI